MVNRGSRARLRRCPDRQARDWRAPRRRLPAIADLPADLDGLHALHGVGPKAVRLLRQARAD